MDIIVFPPDELGVAIGALRYLDREPSPAQWRFLETLSRLHGADVDLHALPTRRPVEAAAIITDEHRRKRLVQLAVIWSMVDGTVTRETAAAVAELAAATDVAEPAVRTLRKLVGRHALETRFAVARRIMTRFIREAWRSKRLAGVLGFCAALLRPGSDRKTAARFHALSKLPSQSFGRVFYEHMTSRQLALPGEPHAIPERMMFHDLGHVLSGYDTDPAGEIQQAAFQAGFMRRDGFAFLFFGIIQFHIGIRLTPIAAAETGYFDVDNVLLALARGAACDADLSDQFDFWARSAHPLEQVRRELSVPPLSAARPPRSQPAVSRNSANQLMLASRYG